MCFFFFDSTKGKKLIILKVKIPFYFKFLFTILNFFGKKLPIPDTLFKVKLIIFIFSFFIKYFHSLINNNYELTLKKY